MTAVAVCVDWRCLSSFMVCCVLLLRVVGGCCLSLGLCVLLIVVDVCGSPFDGCCELCQWLLLLFALVGVACCCLMCVVRCCCWLLVVGCGLSLLLFVDCC